MSTFALVAGLLLLLACAAVIVPLWLSRTQKQPQNLQDAINTRVYHERMAELEQEHATGRINNEQWQQLQQDLQRTLLADIPVKPETAINQASSLRGLATIIGLLVPVLASAYFYLSFSGEPASWIQTQAKMHQVIEQALADPSQFPPAALENLPDFTRTLQARVMHNNWSKPVELLVLGQSFIQLGAVQEARETMLRALALEPDKLPIMLTTAQALLLSNQGQLETTSAQILHQVLQREPQHQGALMMLGFGAFNAGNYTIAEQAWQVLLTQLDPDSQSADLLHNSIAEARRLAANPVKPDQHPAVITVTVDVASELQDKFEPGDTLFIYARAANGPPMPLAAVRQAARDFPVQVVLDDSKAMLPDLKLSSFDEVVVGARISKAGDVQAKTGDLQTLSEPLALGTTPLAVKLTVDQIVQ